MFGKRVSEDQWPPHEEPRQDAEGKRREGAPRLSELRPASDAPPAQPFEPSYPAETPVRRTSEEPLAPARSIALPAPASYSAPRSTSHSRTPMDAPEHHPAYAAVFDAIFTAIDMDQLLGMGARRAREELRDLVAEVDAAQRLALSQDDQDAIAAAIGDDLVGLGPLEALVAREDVQEIRVTAPDLIHVEVNGRRRKAALRFRDTAQLAHICRRLARQAGKTLNADNPVCDVRLADGSHVTVIIPPAAASPALRMRRPHACAASLDTLTRDGVMSRETADILSLAVRARCSILVTGPAGRGQSGIAVSTFLSALAHEIDPAESLAIIEGVRRMAVPHPHAVRLVADQGVSAAAARRRTALTRAATSLGVDRLVVDPLAGPESLEMLHAMAGGQRGSISALYAPDAENALARLETLSGAAVHGGTLQALIAGGVDLIVELALGDAQSLRVARVCEVAGLDEGRLAPRDILAPAHDSEDDNPPLRFVATGRPSFWSRVARTALEAEFIHALRAAR